MKRLIEAIVLFLSGFAIWFAFSLIFAWFASIIYNLVIPDMFGLPPTDYWHMLGFMFLLKILFPNAMSDNNYKK